MKGASSNEDLSLNLTEQKFYKITPAVTELRKEPENIYPCNMVVILSDHDG